MSLCRIDRLITFYCFYPLIRFGVLSRARIPILMYHSISAKDDKRIHLYYKTNTKPEVFTDHMEFLHENHYKVININDAVNYLEVKEKSNEKLAVITFDDGYRDFYEIAFPILKRYGFPATVFLPTGFINQKRSTFNERECLTWEEVRELNSQGIIFGSHTVSHPELKYLSKEIIERELYQSKANIEDKTGKSIESFSYPYAFPEGDKKFVKVLHDILIKCGYKNGVSTAIGTTARNADKFFLKRIPVNSGDDVLFLKAKLEGGYDWLHFPQYLFKFIKRGKYY